MSFDSPLPPYNASDPSATFLSASCLELLMIEIVPMAYRVVRAVDDMPVAQSRRIEGDGETPKEKEGEAEGREGEWGERSMDEDEERDVVFNKLEGLGYRVGQGLVERCVDFFRPDLPSLSQSRSRVVGGGLREGK